MQLRLSSSLLLGLFWLNFAAADAVAVYDKVAPSVYKIVGVDENNQIVVTGSSVAVTPHVLATNCHVLDKEGEAYMEDKEKRYKLQLLYKDTGQDLCLIWVQDLNLRAVSLRKSTDLKIGEKVYAIGNPRDMNRTVSEGLLSNKLPFQEGIILVTSATIAPGSSGGGLFDEKANLLGLTTARDEGPGYAYALPAEWILTQIEKNKGFQEKPPEPAPKPAPKPPAQTDESNLPNPFGSRTNKAPTAAEEEKFGIRVR